MMVAERNAKVDWQATWVWNDGEASPRNEWWCFRKTVDVPEKGWDRARLAITADSRYVLYVNGELVGRGPVRSWPFEQSYDLHEIGHLLNRGEPNTIAVLVLHFGVSTFYYIRGRGGLLAQLDLMRGGSVARTVGTDSSWKTTRHLGQDPSSPRMAPQQAFSERIDARAWDDAWLVGGYDDSGWEGVAIIGPTGTAPWEKLIPRDIPPLTEEVVYPSRVESLRQVKPVRWAAAVDVRSQMVRGSANHSSRVGFTGCIATVVRVSEKSDSVVRLYSSATRNVRACAVNGNVYEWETLKGADPQRYLEVKFEAGDNWLVVDVSAAYDHGHEIRIGIDSDTPFEVVSPLLNGEENSPFVAVGPFSTVTYGLEDPVYSALPTARNLDSAECLAAREIASNEELASFEKWVRPVSKRLVCEEDVFAKCLWNDERAAHPVPYALQNMVIANPASAEVPLYPDGDTELVIDFGRELSGYLSFDVEASEGTVLDLYGFEYMQDGQRQDTFGLDNTLRYVCRQGRQSYTSPVRRGLRYLMVTVRNADAQVHIYGLQLRQSNYPVAEVGEFRCSDPLLNDIWQISRHTTRLCMEDTFVDCPAYEQTFWVGDSRNEALINYYVFGADEIVKRCLRLVPGSKVQTPLYTSQVPSGWSNVIPNWTFFWVQACTEYYHRTGDPAFMREIWPHVRYTLDHYLERLDDRGLLHLRAWNFLDWAPMDQPADGAVTHQNLFLMRALCAAAELAAFAGEASAGASYKEAEDNLRQAINHHLWSEERQAYMDCIHDDGRASTTFSMQTQVVAYLCDAAVKERQDCVERYLLNPPQDFVQIGTPFMSFFYYEALAKAGWFNRIIEDMREKYGWMVARGATTCWEEYPGLSEHHSRAEQFPTRSHCHAWSAAPGHFLGAHVLGIRGSEPGWKEVLVEPQPCGLRWAHGAVPLPDTGRVEVAWTLEEDKTMKIKVRAPRELKVHARLPEGYEGTVERSAV